MSTGWADEFAVAAQQPGASAWADEFAGPRGALPPPPGMDMQAMSLHRPDAWADEFRAFHGPLPPGAALQPHMAGLAPPPQAAAAAAQWADEFATAGREMPGAGDWASEFAQQQASAAPATRDATAAETMAQTRRLAETLAADGNPKMRNSQFLQFLSKMSKGELKFQDNAVVEVAPGEAWAGEFSASAGPAPGAWADEFASASGALSLFVRSYSCPT